jgi:hypothetical protein
VWGPTPTLTNNITDRDHEAQRAAWASSWFLSLLKARRLGLATEHERAQTGLSALGIRVQFDEDIVAPRRRRKEGGGRG